MPEIIAGDRGETVRDRRFSRERRARLEAEAIAEQSLRDLFQRQQEIELLGAIAEAANSARSVPEAMKSALDAICAYTSWPIGHYCSVVTDPIEDQRQVVTTDIWHVSPGPFDEATARREAASLSDQLGLAERILVTRAPLWIADIGADAEREIRGGGRGAAVNAATLRAAFGLPVLEGREVAAVLEFFAPTSVAPDPSRLELFTHVGVQLGRVIERERAQAQTVDAFHDSLTHLPNRALFVRFVERALKRQERYGDHMFAVLFIDLDSFKAVNDSLGHRVGDALLLQIGMRLSQTIRVTDSIGRAVAPAVQTMLAESPVARLGGDEFTVLLENIRSVGDALLVAERIHTALAKPITLDSGVEIFASASIGIAWSRPGHHSADDLLQDADTAMYRAKAGGKRRSEIFDEDMHQQAIAQLQLETDLRRAVERDELFLDYQPIVRLDSGDVWGFEALVRWRHPVRGIVHAPDFIPIAEDKGMIIEIGTWVVKQACQQLRTWQHAFSRPRLTMAVNLSARQFGQIDLIAQVEAVLRDYDIPTNCLSLELTETVAMGTPDTSRRTLAALRALGVDLAIDDFGTGYSSLSYLGQFRVNGLKIDRSFIRQLDEDYGEALVQAVLSLGSHLGLRVVAEGVETEREAEHLRRLGCVYAQGFHFHRPLPALEIEGVLR